MCGYKGEDQREREGSQGDKSQFSKMLVSNEGVDVALGGSKTVQCWGQIVTPILDQDVYRTEQYSTYSCSKVIGSLTAIKYNGLI